MPEREVPPLHIRIPLIQVAAFFSEASTFPIDSVKTRMQVCNPVTRPSPSPPPLPSSENSHARRDDSFLLIKVVRGTSSSASFRAVLKHTVRNEGSVALYKGIQPAVIRHFVYSAARVVLYEDIRNGLSGSTAGTDAPFWTKLVAGFTAGGVAQLLASPADLVKVRLQTCGSAYTGFGDCVRKIYAAEGAAGFYRGWRPNVARACMVNLGELATYDQSKRLVLDYTGMEDGLGVHVLSGLTSGFFAAFFSTPADVCKSRVVSILSSH